MLIRFNLKRQKEQFTCSREEKNRHQILATLDLTGELFSKVESVFTSGPYGTPMMILNTGKYIFQTFYPQGVHCLLMLVKSKSPKKYPIWGLSNDLFSKTIQRFAECSVKKSYFQFCICIITETCKKS